MNCVVIGFGSIGRRHARLLAEAGHRVGVVTRSDGGGYPVFRAVEEAMERFAPEFAVIANDTRLHGSTLRALAAAEFAGATLVEKPCLATADEAVELPPGPVYVGYVLRFHPLMARMLEWVGGRPLWTATIYAGLSLPDWRPGRDYRESYSARVSDGGVIRDLSHELDYAQLLAGTWRRTVAAGGHISHLSIESEDAACILAECERCPLVGVHLNYLDRSLRRDVVLNSEQGTLQANFATGTLGINGQTETIAVERDAMFRAQLAAAIAGGDGRLCRWESAMDTVRWVDAAHRSIRECRWIESPPAPRRHG